MNNIKVWKQGEADAVRFLKKNKYKIIETNHRNMVGEIDIIALTKAKVINDKLEKIYVFIEVKARSSLKFGNPSEIVNFYKQNKLKSCAEEYIKEHKLSGKYFRFDVIEWLNGKINHIQNAFEINN